MNSTKIITLFAATLSIVNGAPELTLANGTFSSPAGNNMSYGDAEAYCKTLGGHLPDVREIANWAMSQGASGIKETSLPGHVLDDPAVKAEIIQMAAQGYQMIQKNNLWAPAVDFYYKGFQEGSQGDDAKFWSSSTELSNSSLARGMISLVRGTEQKFTLSGLNGSLGEDAANTGRNAVICAMETMSTPPAAPANPTSDTTVSIDPHQIDFSVEGNTVVASITDASGKKVESVKLNTSNLGRDTKSLQISKDYCTGVAEKAASENLKITLDLSYQKPVKFCLIQLASGQS